MRPATGATSWNGSPLRNPAIAEVLNRHFVSIKVDREERPDLDETYMLATQLMTGRGGWPNSVWLLPDGRPWYAGTYFPPEDQMGRIGFKSLLLKLAEIWRQRRAEVEEQARVMTETIRRHAQGPAPRGSAGRADPDRACPRAVCRTPLMRGRAGSARPRSSRRTPAWPSCSTSNRSSRIPPSIRCCTHPARPATGRHPRPRGRRLSSLRHRRGMAGAPFRENALRQRAAGVALHRSLAAKREESGLSPDRGRHPGLGACAR
jgi:hypothetical protein